VDSRNPRIELQCPHCGASEVLDESGLIHRLQAEGMLRREKEPDWDLAEQLLRSRANDLSCRDCGATGLNVVSAGRTYVDEWDDGRNCERCGKVIPAERLEVFPDSRCCSACQQKSEQGDSGEEAEFCSHCGAVLKLRQSQRGLARYVMYCPDCGRS
jgi:RNA polymerase-binding transcription factor DksA